MRILKQPRTPVLSASTFWTILLFFSTFFTTTFAIRIPHTSSLFIYDPQWKVTASESSTDPTPLYSCLNGSLFFNYQGGNITIYGIQPSENAQVTFEAWTNSRQVPVVDLESDSDINDTTSTNGTARALKTIVVTPGEQQLYLRITNLSEDFFWFTGVDVIPMEGSDTIMPNIHGIDAIIVDSNLASSSSSSSSSGSSVLVPLATGASGTTSSSAPIVLSAIFPTPIPTALIMPDSHYLTYGPMSSVLPSLAYFSSGYTENSDASRTEAGEIGGATPTAILRRQESDTTTRPSPTSTSSSTSTSTTTTSSPIPTSRTSTETPASTQSSLSPTATPGYQGFNTSYSGWIFANDPFLARYAAVNNTIPDADFAYAAIDYGTRAVNRMNIIDENGTTTTNAANRGTTAWSSTVGSTVKFRFYGTQLFLFAPISNRPGSAAITIDNLPPSVVNLDAQNAGMEIPIVQRLVYWSSLLDEDYHDVGITVVSGQFAWDFFKIVGTPIGTSIGTDAATSLGMGAKIALGICIPLLVGLILFGVWFWIRRRKEKNALAGGEHKAGLGQKSKIFSNLKNLPSLPLHLPHRQPKPPVPYPTSPDTSDVLTTDSSDTYVLLPKYSSGPNAHGRYHDQKSHNHNLGSTPSPNTSSNRNAGHGGYAALGRSGSSSSSHYSDDSHERHGRHLQPQVPYDRSSSFVSGVSSVDPPFSYTQTSDFRDLTASPVPSSIVHGPPQPQPHHQHHRQRSSGNNNPFNPSNPFTDRNGRGRVPSGSSRVWSPPPPSYLTMGSNAGHGALAMLRNGGNGANGTNSTGMMALSHEALARLVDRVAALRAMSEKELLELRDMRGSQRDGESDRRRTISSSDGPDGTDGSGVWTEDDEVEALARQIAAIDRRI